MRYESIIELENVTLEDCIKLNENENAYVIINDGRISGFVKD